MKKIVGAVVVLALMGGVAYAVVHNPERSACMKMADLCGVKGGTKDDLDHCMEEIEQFHRDDKFAGRARPTAPSNICASCGSATHSWSFMNWT